MSIFDKYNLGIVAKAVDLFYGRAVASEQLAIYFKNVDMAKLRTHQIELLSHVMGGPVTQRINRLKYAHQKLNITDKDFDAIAIILQQSLGDVGIEKNDIDHIMNVVESTRDLIVK